MTTSMEHKRKVEVEMSANDVIDIIGNFGLPEITDIAISLVCTLSDQSDKHWFNKLRDFVNDGED